MITMSELARQKVVEFMDEERQLTGTKESLILRVAVEAGGCSGLQYNLSIDEKRNDDLLIDFETFQAAIDEQSKNILALGLHIDYQDALTNGGFKVINPAAASSCECGKSFEPDASVFEV